MFKAFLRKDNNVMAATINGVEVKGTPEQVKEIIKMLVADKVVAPTPAILPKQLRVSKYESAPKTRYGSAKTYVSYERLSHNWTQVRIAKMMNCSSSHYARIEQGQIKPTREEVDAICAIFKMDAKMLFDDAWYAKKRE